jgi:hypothetical protein
MTLKDILYTPVLKGETNDLKALGKVPAAYRASQIPVLEMPRPVDALQLEKVVTTFGSRIRKYSSQQRFAADLMPIAPGADLKGIPAIRFALSLLRNLGLKFVPVHGLDRESDLWDEVAGHAGRTGSDVLFRLDVEDIEDPEASLGEILSLTKSAGIGAERVVLVADLRSLHGIDALQLSMRYQEVIGFAAAALSTANFGRVSVAGSSLPKTVVTVPEDGVADFPRHEYLFHLSATAELGPDSLAFGDYGVVFPDFSVKAPAIHANAKIRYARGDRHVVFRGHSLRKEPKFRQYHDLAGRVLSDSAYMGRDFSYGDEYIWRCANRECGTGNLGTWVEVDMNHHLVQTNQMLPLAIQRIREGLAVEDVLVEVT